MLGLFVTFVWFLFAGLFCLFDIVSIWVSCCFEIGLRGVLICLVFADFVGVVSYCVFRWLGLALDCC